MAVKKPDLVSYAQRAKPVQSSGAAKPSAKSSGGNTQKPDLVAYAKRVNAQKSAGPAQNTTANTDAWTRATASQTRIPEKTASNKNSGKKSFFEIATQNRAPGRVAYGKRKSSDSQPATTQKTTSKNQWVSTGGGRKSTTDAGKTNGYVADASKAKDSFVQASRVKNTVTGAAKTAGAGYVNVGGMLAEGAGKLNTAIANANAGASLQSDIDAVKSYQNMLRDMKWADGKSMTAADVKKVQGYLAAAERRVNAHQTYTKAVEASDKAAADKAYQKADELQASGEQDIAKAKEGLGTVGQFAVDLGVAGAQMAGDMAASAVIPGAGLASMAVRSGGSSAQKARQAGATYNQQLAYGIGSGALSLATEKISNVATPFKKAFGGGVLDRAISSAVAKMNGNAAGKLALSMLSEGGEEFIEDVFQPVLQRATYDKSARFDLSEALYDAAVGAAMGGIGGAVDIVRERSNAPTASQEAAGAQTDVRESSYAPTAQASAEGTQTTPQAIQPKQANQTKTLKPDALTDILFGKKRVDQSILTNEQFDTLAQRNDVGMDAAGRVYQMDPAEHISQRDMASVGNKAVNAFQFDHPELHSYYQQAAADLIADADLSLQMPQSRRYERTAQGNAVVQQSQTSQALRTAMDETGLSRDAIIDAAQRIINDQGQENVAAAKRVELILDGMLSDGYTTMDGRTVAPNERYLSAKGDIPGMVEQSREPLPIFDMGNVTDTPGDAAAGAVNTDFDRMQAQSDTFHPVNENSARRIMNEQNRAPSEVPTVNPDTGNSITKTVSTILNSPLTSPEMTSIYESAIAGGKFDYTVQTDRDAVQRAQAHIARDGWQTVANTFIGKVDLGQSVSKVEMAEAISAYNTAVSEGNRQAAFELGVAIADAAHTGAQVTQAMNLMNRLTPEGKLLTLRKFVDKMNRKQEAKTRRKSAKVSTQADIDNTRLNYTEDFTGFRISDELASNYLMAETDAERAAAWDAITTDIASQLPSTFREKADFVRYSSMLTNPTTHIRNVLGNAIQAGARTLKNGIGAAIERAAIKDQSQRTKSLLVGEDAKALKDFARGQYETDQSAAMGAGKYSDYSYRSIDREIMSKKKAFKGDNLLSRGIQAIGDFNSMALDAEDVLFNKSAYVDSFAQALKAKGVTAEEAKAGMRTADVDAARAYAIEEARRATYRNTTALSEALSKMGRYEGDNPVLKAASFAADAFMPFRRTPANILTTGLDYSPVGLIKAVTADAVKVKNGTMSGADMVDHLSSGLTGTGVLALGAYLAAEGLLHVRAGDDDKEEAFEKASGKQDYALQIGDYSYSLDWAVPAAMPLFAGAAIMQSAEKGGSSFDAVVDAMLGMQDVVLETSMLSSLNDLVGNISYAKSKPMYLIDRAISSYASQYIPTVGSKIASALDDTARKSYVEKGTGQVSSDVNYFLQGAAKKIPGARNQLQPSIDLWGNEVPNGSAPARVFQSFLSPGYLKKADESAATKEVRRLAEATGDSSVYPTAMDKAFTVNGKEKTLTAAEYTQYAKSAGSTRKKLIEEAVDLPDYKAMSNTEKAAYVKRAYDYAKYTARKELDSGYEADAWVENAKNAKRDIGVSTAEYLALYEKYGGSVMSGKGYDKVKRAVSAGLTVEEYMGAKDSADTDGNGSVTKAEAAAWISKSGKKNKADLWDIICTTNAKNPYK